MKISQERLAFEVTNQSRQFTYMFIS